VSDDGVRFVVVGGKRPGEPDEKACCRLQIEVRVPELVSKPEMVTTKSKIIKEELTEVTVILNEGKKRRGNCQFHKKRNTL